MDAEMLAFVLISLGGLLVFAAIVTGYEWLKDGYRQQLHALDIYGDNAELMLSRLRFDAYDSIKTHRDAKYALQQIRDTDYRRKFVTW